MFVACFDLFKYSPFVFAQLLMAYVPCVPKLGYLRVHTPEHSTLVHLISDILSERTDT